MRPAHIGLAAQQMPNMRVITQSSEDPKALRIDVECNKVQKAKAEEPAIEGENSYKSRSNSMTSTTR